MIYNFQIKRYFSQKQIDQDFFQLHIEEELSFRPQVKKNLI